MVTANEVIAQALAVATQYPHLAALRRNKAISITQPRLEGIKDYQTFTGWLTRGKKVYRVTRNSTAVVVFRWE